MAVFHRFEDFAEAIAETIRDRRSGVRDGLRDALKDFGLRWRETMKTRLRGTTGAYAAKAKPPDEPPSTRSGAMSRSFGYRLEARTIREMVAAMYSTGGVAVLAQEYGTRGRAPDSPIDDIVPKNARYLTIPLPDALTASGLPREGRKSIRDWPDGFFMDLDGRLVYAREGPGASLEFLFLLTQGPVRLYPRLGMRKTFEKGIPRFRRDVRSILRGGKGGSGR